MESTFLSHLTSAALVIYFIQALKKRAWYQRFAAWVPIADGWVHRLVSLLGAGIGALGIHTAVEGNLSAGWHVGLTIPPLLAMAHALWDLANQYALQQLAYDAVAQKAGKGAA